MKQDLFDFEFHQWQQEFFDGYLSSPKARTLLVAPPGTGKTVASLYVMKRMLEEKTVDVALLLSSHKALVHQWRHAASELGIELSERLGFRDKMSAGAAMSIQSLQKNYDKLISKDLENLRWVIILDDAHHLTKSRLDFVERILTLNEETKALFLSTQHLEGLTYDAEYSFETEFIFRRSILESSITERRLQIFSPSFGLLRKLQRNNQNLEDLTWRQFEKLVSELLIADGYTVELMRGTKDGGVDVVAVKDLGESGLFKGIWQAKKLSGSRKVGISTIRELADTRKEFGASKGLIVTSTYLTKGALERIERDCYTLGKVDRNELDAWISRILTGERV